MHMNTDMCIYTDINMFLYMCVLWCRVMSCVARRCWLVGWVGGWVGVVMSSFRIVFLSFCRLLVNFAVTPPCRVAVVLCVSCSSLVVAVSSCGGPCLKSVPVTCDKYIATGNSGAFNDRASPILKMGKIWRLFGEPLGHLSTLCGQILVNGTGGDFFFFSFGFVFVYRVDVCGLERRGGRVYVQNVSVCTGTTRTC